MSSQSVGKEMSGFLYPMLTRVNYSSWSIKMQAMMEACDIWEVIVMYDDSRAANVKKNKLARATLLNAIPEDILFLVANKENAKDVWDALKVMFHGAKRVQEAKVQSLKEELDSLKMMEKETVDDYAIKVCTLVGKIRELGVSMDDSYVVKRMLRSLPSRFLQIVTTIEQFVDLNELTIEELVGRLKVHDERIKGAAMEVKHDEIMFVKSNCRPRDGRGNWRSFGQERGHEGDHGSVSHEQGSKERDYESDSRDGASSSGGGNRNWQRRAKFDKSKVRCFNCHKLGHFARDCWSKGSDGKATYALEKKEEPFVLMSKKEVLKFPPKQSTKWVRKDETTVCPKFGKCGSNKRGKWNVHQGVHKKVNEVGLTSKYVDKKTWRSFSRYAFIEKRFDDMMSCLESKELMLHELEAKLILMSEEITKREHDLHDLFHDFSVSCMDTIVANVVNMLKEPLHELVHGKQAEIPASMAHVKAVVKGHKMVQQVPKSDGKKVNKKAEVSEKHGDAKRVISSYLGGAKLVEKKTANKKQVEVINDGHKDGKLGKKKENEKHETLMKNCVSVYENTLYDDFVEERKREKENFYGGDISDGDDDFDHVRYGILL